MQSTIPAPRASVSETIVDVRCERHRGYCLASCDDCQRGLRARIVAGRP